MIIDKKTKWEDLKTDSDFDKWYGRKKGWQKCSHEFIPKRDSVYDEIYEVEQCTKCWLQIRT